MIHTPSNFKQIRLNRGLFAMVDEADVEQLNKFKWSADNTTPTRTYARRYGSGNKKIAMHRQIMNAQPGQIIDHINGNGLDNRRCNLRFVTHRENSINSIRRQSNTGYRGVWRKPRKSGGYAYKASICNFGVITRLGTFDTAEEAARAYNRAAQELHGEFAWLNELPSNNGGRNVG